jgi:hypothetical protein
MKFATCFLIFLFMCCSTVSAQDEAVFKSEADSLAYIDSLRTVLKDLLKTVNTSVSFADISIGVGNGSFSEKTANSVSAISKKAFYSLYAGYYHKTGFGITANGLFTSDSKKLTMFQSSISPSYDYTKNSDWGFGFSYSRYFNEDSLSFYTTPLVNEWYAYGVYKGGWLRTSLAFDYAKGNISDVYKSSRLVIRRNPQTGRLDTLRLNVTQTTNTKIRDISTLLSMQHSFDWYGNKDAFSFTPTLLIVAGTANYGTNLQSTGFFQGPRGNLIPAQNNSTTVTSKDNFKIQSASLIFNATYSVGKFYLQPQVLIDYAFPTTSPQWNAVFNISIGATF